MPVFFTSDVSGKYIHFQRLAEEVGTGWTTTPEASERKAHTGSGNFIWFGSITAGSSSILPRRAEDGNGLPFVPAVDSEVTLIHREDGVPWIKLAHANKTEIGEVRLALPVAFRKFRELLDIPIAVERESQHFVLQQRKHVGTGFQMKRRFGEDRLAGQQGLGNSSGNVHSPAVVLVVPSRESDNEAGVGDSLHERENPLREERSGGPPVISPAWRRN